jgi:Metallo-beta-lactamase superfamily
MTTKKIAKKAPVKKVPAKKTPAKKTPAKKASAKKAPAKRTPAKKISPTMPHPASPPTAATEATGTIRVRMYRQGLGDCFLITMPGKSGDFHMVIDCGVVLGTDAKGISKLTSAVQDISTTTDNKIDLLVLTHEHWDHVSGFHQAKDLIEKWNVADVWTAWTEDPKDTLANKIRAERRKTEAALRLAMARLVATGSSEQSERLASVLGFFGATSGSTADALTYAKGLAGKNLRFCQPGEPAIELPELPGIRFWVLGPPKDEKLLHKSNPGKEEAYGLDDGSTASNAMFLKALTRSLGASEQAAAAPEDATLDDPFEARFQIPLTRAEHLPFFEEHYFGEVDDASLYDRKQASAIRNQSWRRIDGTWLDTSETLALAMDSATNNTSLVLALEIVATGEILLFPGDAQAGNWLSWQGLQWSEKNSSGKDIVTTVPDLLARTIFYKVGHHGSHNATLKEKGLELMTRDGLIAMIPVDHAMAVKKRWGKMPLPELVDHLNEKTNCRVLRIDDATQTQADLVSVQPKSVSAADWKTFTDRVTTKELYFEVTI